MAYKDKEVYNPYTGQTIRFLQTSCDTDGELLEMESTWQPHSQEPPPHYHPVQEETFRVLEGSITVRINGITYTLEKGDHLVVPPRTVHSMWNSTGDIARVNWQVRPAMTTEHLLEMGMGLAADGRVGKKGTPSVLQSAVLLTSYARVYRLAKPSPLVQKMIFGLLRPIGLLAGYRPVNEKYVHAEPKCKGR